MIKRISLAVICALFTILAINACKHKPYPKPGGDGTYGGFPDEIGKIMVNRCATAGCHNEATRSGGLLLDSWEHLFEGGTNGACVIAYNPQYSSLLYFINTDSSRGIPVAVPTMPEDGTALTNDEFNLIREWIANGAPNRNGDIPFGSEPDTRQKVYLTMQACDLVGVIDGKSNLMMRYIKVGDPSIATNLPHCIRVAPDGKYAYVSFLDGRWVQKINTATDKIEKNLLLADDGSRSWNILYVTPNNKELLVSNWLHNGFMAWVNAENMTQNDPIPFTLRKPHGITSNAAGDTFYITAEAYNAVYKLVPPRPGKDAFFDTISIVKGQAPNLSDSNSAPQPHEIMMTPDGSKYFLTCQRSNEIRVMDAHADTLIKVFSTPEKPQEIAMSKKRHQMYFTCMEPSKGGVVKGAVYVIDYETMQWVKTITNNRFNQPHGITVDDQNDRIYIASTNTDGPAPHHPSSGCAGKNGYYQVYDLNTLEPVNNRSYEVSPFPYSADVRFK